MSYTRPSRSQSRESFLDFGAYGHTCTPHGRLCPRGRTRSRGCWTKEGAAAWQHGSDMRELDELGISDVKHSVAEK